MFCLNLVFNVWPSSVLPSSGNAKFDFWHILPKSGLGKTSVLPKSVLPSSGAPHFLDLFLTPSSPHEHVDHAASPMVKMAENTTDVYSFATGKNQGLFGRVIQGAHRSCPIQVRPLRQLRTSWNSSEELLGVTQSMSKIWDIDNVLNGKIDNVQNAQRWHYADRMHHWHCTEWILHNVRLT